MFSPDCKPIYVYKHVPKNMRVETEKASGGKGIHVQQALVMTCLTLKCTRILELSKHLCCSFCRISFFSFPSKCLEYRLQVTRVFLTRMHNLNDRELVV